MSSSQIAAERVLAPAPGARPGGTARPHTGPRGVGTGRLNAARGVIVGLGIGLACWSLIGAAAWLWMA